MEQTGRRATTVTERDAAAYVGYRVSTLRKWRAQQRGPAYIQQARSIRYLIADLDHWLQQHRVEPETR